MIIENEQIFQANKYDESRIKNIAKVFWYDIHSSIRPQIVRKIHYENLQLMDHANTLSFKGEEEILIFHIEDAPNRFLSSLSNTLFELNIETEFDRLLVKRRVFTSFDFIASIGGLVEGLAMIFLFIARILQPQAGDWKIIGYLFNSNHKFFKRRPSI